MKSINKYFLGLTKNSFLLAFASLFTDISTEMLYPILPIYLSQFLGVSGGIIGIIDGIALATQNIFQGLFGSLSDKLQKRKGIALIGYMLSTISKPLMGASSIWQTVLIARLGDRLGAGMRAAPRDALIASSVEIKNRGKAFGLEGFGDNLGAFIGPIITIILFFYLQLSMRSIFYFSIIPGFFAVIMILMVHEKNSDQNIKSKIELKFKHFPRTYWKYLLVTLIFGLGNSSNAFLILSVKDHGLSLLTTIFVYSLFNLVAALISYPSGTLSDKLGRKYLLFIAFIIFFITYTGFIFSTNFFIIGTLFVFYGLFQGIFRSVGKSLASDLVPAKLQASGIGWYSSVVGISGLIASIVAGQLWDKFGHTAVFIYGAFFAITGAFLLLIFVDNPINKIQD